MYYGSEGIYISKNDRLLGVGLGGGTQKLEGRHRTASSSKSSEGTRLVNAVIPDFEPPEL